MRMDLNPKELHKFRMTWSMLQFIIPILINEDMSLKEKRNLESWVSSGLVPSKKGASAKTGKGRGGMRKYSISSAIAITTIWELVRFGFKPYMCTNIIEQMISMGQKVAEVAGAMDEIAQITYAIKEGIEVADAIKKVAKASDVIKEAGGLSELKPLFIYYDHSDLRPGRQMSISASKEDIAYWILNPKKDGNLKSNISVRVDAGFDFSRVPVFMVLDAPQILEMIISSYRHQKHYDFDTYSAYGKIKLTNKEIAALSKMTIEEIDALYKEKNDLLKK